MARNFIGHQAFKGRGAISNPAVRFEATRCEPTHDGWYEDEIVEHLHETVLPDSARSVITRNNFPDGAVPTISAPPVGAEMIEEAIGASVRATNNTRSRSDISTA